jgi:hypothetical protein
MPDDASTADTTTDTTATTADTAGQTFTQEQVNSFLAEQKRKIGDIKELKAAAAELAAIKDAQKTTEQRAADRQSAADAQIAAIPAKVSDALRAHLVALHKIPADDAELFLTASDPEVLLKQVERLVARGVEGVADRKKQGNFVSREGTNPKSEGDSDLREFTRSLFATGD